MEYTALRHRQLPFSPRNPTTLVTVGGANLEINATANDFASIFPSVVLVNYPVKKRLSRRSIAIAI
jgi:hypothetical protein